MKRIVIFTAVVVITAWFIHWSIVWKIVSTIAGLFLIWVMYEVKHAMPDPEDNQEQYTEEQKRFFTGKR